MTGAPVGKKQLLQDATKDVFQSHSGIDFLHREHTWSYATGQVICVKVVVQERLHTAT